MQAIDLYSAEVLPTSHRAIGIALANWASYIYIYIRTHIHIYIYIRYSAG
jgi:hypothetical protein